MYVLPCSLDYKGRSICVFCKLDHRSR